MGKRINNVRSFASPSKYIQGCGLINDLENFTIKYGRNLAIIIDSFLYDDIKQKLAKNFSSENNVQYFSKSGEITLENINLYKEKMSSSTDVFVAIGGGKTIDTVKAVANDFGKPVIVIPTVASTDAPTSALSVIYKNNGEHSHEIHLKQNPDLVLVDTEIIAKAPTRLLVAGMGDALATYFEAVANEKSFFENVIAAEMNMCLGPSIAAKEIAKVCYKILLEDGFKAKIACDLNIVTEALENIVEANTLLSGIGFESNGTAAAHAINDGLTIIPEAAKMYHGERVGFGVLCQLILENASKALLDEVFGFCIAVNLPVTLEELGIKNISEEDLNKVAKTAYDNVIHAEPLAITIDNIKSAILVADGFGKSYKR